MSTYGGSTRDHAGDGSERLCGDADSRARPAWAGEASTDVDCSVWTARYSASAEPKSWRLRAARRGYLCLEAAGKDPQPAWLASLELSLDEPHSLELTERYCSRANADPEDPVLAQAAQRSDLLTAACALEVAERLKGEPQRQALKRAVAADPHGVRGRRAMLALARQASGDAERRVWLRRHRAAPGRLVEFWSRRIRWAA